MHCDETCTVLGGNRRQARGDVVQQACPCSERSMSDRRLGSCRPTPGPPRQAPRRRARRGAVPRPRVPSGTWARRLTTNVDEVGALVEDFAATADGRIVVQVPTAVEERVGCDVEHAHDEGDHTSSVEVQPPPTSHESHRLGTGGRVGAGTGPAPPRSRSSVPGFRTPRIDMQRCSASITTSTPRAGGAPLDRRRRSGSSSALGPEGAARRRRRPGRAWRAR